LAAPFSVELAWNGEEVGAELMELAAKAFVEAVAPEWESFAKAQLWPGHGVDTEALQKSIHMAPAGYDWSADDVPPSPAAPERGGQRFTPEITDFVFEAEFGSGQSYALYVHQGVNREGIPFISRTLEALGPRTAEIVATYVRDHYARSL
jgi:hypothetical protein